MTSRITFYVMILIPILYHVIIGGSGAFNMLTGGWLALHYIMCVLVGWIAGYAIGTELYNWEED